MRQPVDALLSCSTGRLGRAGRHWRRSSLLICAGCEKVRSEASGARAAALEAPYPSHARGAFLPLAAAPRVRRVSFVALHRTYAVAPARAASDFDHDSMAGSESGYRHPFDPPATRSRSRPATAGTGTAMAGTFDSPRAAECRAAPPATRSTSSDRLEAYAPCHRRVGGREITHNSTRSHASAPRFRKPTAMSASPPSRCRACFPGCSTPRPGARRCSAT